MRRATYPLCLLLACLTFVTAGCSDGPDRDEQAPPDELMAPEERDAALGALAEAYQRLAPRSNPDKREEFIALVKAHPGFRDAGWSTEGDNFWAVFADGVGCALLDNQRPPEDPAPQVESQPRAPTRQAQALVPQDKKALVLFSLGSAFTNNTYLLAGSLGEAGYSVSAGTGTIELLLQSVKAVGYLYWQSHSGFIGPAQPVITTSSRRSAALDAQEPLKGLLQSKQVVIAGATTDRIEAPADTNGNGKIDEEERVKLEWVYGVTPDFVRANLEFGATSVVVMDSCTSAHHEFASAFHDAGAHLYVGWSAVSRPRSQMALFSDRLLGGSAFGPRLEPLPRPFDHGATLDWMRARGLDSDGHGAVIQASLKPGSRAGILTPSIERITIEESLVESERSVMTLKGDFGPLDDSLYPREVLVTGQSLEITGGSDTEIKALIPNRGLGSGGNARVRVGGRHSNVVPITSWDIPLHYVLQYPFPAHYEIDLLLRFRGDVHKSRASLEAAPTGPTLTLKPMSTSTLTWRLSGSSSECTFSGSGSYTLGPPEHAFILLFGELAFDVAEARMGPLKLPAVLAGNGAAICHGTSSAWPIMALRHDPLAPYAFESDGYTLLPGEESDVIENPDAGDSTYRFYWGRIEPFFPPLETTQASLPGPAAR